MWLFFSSSLLLEVGGESQPQCADLCLPHVPALIYRGNYHCNSSPLHSENSRSQLDIKTSSSYIFLLCSGSTQTLTHTSFAQCTHSRGNLRLVHFADSAYFSIIAFSKLQLPPGCHGLPRIASSSFSWCGPSSSPSPPSSKACSSSCSLPLDSLTRWDGSMFLLAGLFVLLFLSVWSQSSLTDHDFDRNGGCFWQNLCVNTFVPCICSFLWFY